MGRLVPQTLPWSRQLGLLWEEIRDGTLVWHEPTPEQKAIERARRSELFKGSNVPWIVADIGGLLTAYDDAQDVVSFSNWNRRAFAPGAFRDCIEGRALAGETGLAAATRCLCPFGRSSKRILAAAGGGWGTLLSALFLGAPFALGLRLLPFTAPVMWGLLAGQVLFATFGIGLRLGPLVGASLELTYRSLAELGFPFGVDGNKFNQLQRARIIAAGDRLLGAGAVLRTGDRLTATAALAMAYRDIHPAGEIVIQPQDYPRAGNLLRDPFGTIRAAASLASSLLPNAAAYAANQWISPALAGMSKLQGGDVPPETQELSPKQRAAMRAIHRGKCPREDACTTGIADYLRFLELTASLHGDGLVERKVRRPDGTWESVWTFGGPEVERIALGVDDTIWGGLFRPVSAF